MGLDSARLEKLLLEHPPKEVHAVEAIEGYCVVERGRLKDINEGLENVTIDTDLLGWVRSRHEDEGKGYGK